MSAEEDIRSKLTGKFPALSEKTRIDRARRIFTEVEYKSFRQVFEFIAKGLNFPMLCAITGLDEGENLSFLYHLTNEKGVILSLKTSVPKADPVLRTVIDIFPSAENYEREVVDLFGANVEGLPLGNRYPLTDDWPKGQYPLRKDWKESTCAEGGVA
jgi:membrane-bound hydrogenase subunit beta